MNLYLVIIIMIIELELAFIIANALIKYEGKKEFKTQLIKYKNYMKLFMFFNYDKAITDNILMYLIKRKKDTFYVIEIVKADNIDIIRGLISYKNNGYKLLFKNNGYKLLFDEQTDKFITPFISLLKYLFIKFNKGITYTTKTGADFLENYLQNLSRKHKIRNLKNS